ncbi:MAG: CoA ester lyase [Proteobacteria bacterium]|nr:CoA ester lyase [Pseudomonadota bacterium]
MPAYRSWLFAPGNHSRRVEKVFTLGADAVILDLEDSVPIAEKTRTRAAVAAAVATQHPGRTYVRINDFSTDWCAGDLAATIVPGLAGIVLPKVEDRAQAIAADWLMKHLERLQGLPLGGIELVPIIETGRGVAAARDIAASTTRVNRLCFGAGDYAKDMGMRWTRDEAAFQAARAEIVLASRLARIEPPIDTVWIEIPDMDGLTASAVRVRDMGFQGKLCIHPNQVAAVNTVFTPTDEEIAFAEKIVTAFAEAETSGAAAIQLDGRMIDYPIVDSAKRTLALIAAIRGG